MATTSLAAEMDTINVLMQQHIGLGMDPDKVNQAASANIKAKILNMNHGQVTTADGAVLTDKLRGMTALSEQHKVELALCIQRAMQQHSNHICQPTRSIGAYNACQSLKNIFKYLTANDWAILDDRDRGIGMQVTTVADRLTKLGLFHASEETKRWGVAVLCAVCFTQLPSPKSAYALRTDLTEQIITLAEGRRGLYQLPAVVKYPDAPDGLSTEHYTHAYDASDPPAAREIPRLHNIALWVPMRSTNKLLRDDTTQPIQMKPGMIQNHMPQMQQLYNMMQQMCAGVPAEGALSCALACHIYIYIYI